MELYVAKFDYEKEREDILSFKEGDKFHIASKADKKWWAAYALGTGEYGYVPSMYLEVSIRYDTGLPTPHYMYHQLLPYIQSSTLYNLTMACAYTFL